MSNLQDFLVSLVDRYNEWNEVRHAKKAFRRYRELFTSDDPPWHQCMSMDEVFGVDEQRTGDEVV